MQVKKLDAWARDEEVMDFLSAPKRVGKCTPYIAILPTGIYAYKCKERKNFPMKVTNRGQAENISASQ